MCGASGIWAISRANDRTSSAGIGRGGGDDIADHPQRDTDEHVACSSQGPGDVVSEPTPSRPIPAGSTVATMPVADLFTRPLSDVAELERSVARSATIVGGDVSPDPACVNSEKRRPDGGR